MNTIYKNLSEYTARPVLDMIKDTLLSRKFFFTYRVNEYYNMWSNESYCHGLVYRDGDFKSLSDILSDYILSDSNLVSAMFNIDYIFEIHIGFHTKDEPCVLSKEKTTRMRYSIDYEDIRTINVEYTNTFPCTIGPYGSLFKPLYFDGITYARINDKDTNIQIH